MSCKKQIINNLREREEERGGGESTLNMQAILGIKITNPGVAYYKKKKKMTYRLKRKKMYRNGKEKGTKYEMYISTCPFDTFSQELAFARQTLGTFSIVHFHSSYVLIRPTRKFDSSSSVAIVEQLYTKQKGVNNQCAAVILDENATYCDVTEQLCSSSY